MSFTAEYIGGPMHGTLEALTVGTYEKCFEQFEVRDWDAWWAGTGGATITRFCHRMGAVERMLLSEHGRYFPTTRFWLEITEVRHIEASERVQSQLLDTAQD